MKTVIAILTLVLATSAVLKDDKANTYVCENGKTHFYASTPLEDVEATSNSTVCAINIQTRKVYAKVPMNTFQFKKSLMQEHFNESYVESDKYPFAMLEATIVENIDFKKDGVYPVTLKGIFEVHGVKKPKSIKGKLTVKNGGPYNATGEFQVPLADHNIKVPSIAIAKIAEVVKVDVNFTFEKYQQEVKKDKEM